LHRQRLGPDSVVRVRTVLGIDVAAGRWVAVRLEDGRFAGDDLDPVLERLLGRHGDAEVVGIDVPIGLPALGEPRACDLAAREALGPRRSSVFLAPAEELLLLGSHAEATARSLARTGKGISIQAYGLRAAILEAAPLARAPGSPLREVHPELAFLRAAGGAPLAASKKTWDGQHARRRSCTGVGIVLPDGLARAGGVPVDDVLDAAIARGRRTTSPGATASSLPAGARPAPAASSGPDVRPGSSGAGRPPRGP
jgi:predicted RNase H-like nuclease